MTNSPVWVQILIALIGSSLISTIISIVLSPIITRQEVRKLEITYHQKLNDNFIQNTRKDIDTIYVPINKGLSKLEDDYKRYRGRKRMLETIERARREVIKRHALLKAIKISPIITDENITKANSIMSTYEILSQEGLDDLNRACKIFKNMMEEIIGQAKDSYLPLKIDERLRSFTLCLGLIEDDAWSIESKHVTINDKLLIDQKRYEKHFLSDIQYLKSYIKEIILGVTQHK